MMSLHMECIHSPSLLDQTMGRAYAACTAQSVNCVGIDLVHFFVCLGHAPSGSLWVCTPVERFGLQRKERMIRVDIWTNKQKRDKQRMYRPFRSNVCCHICSITHFYYRLYLLRVVDSIHKRNKLLPL
jgi:hypothetical protein